MSSHQQARRVCGKVSAQYSKAPKSSSRTTRIESQSLHQALRGEALPWSPKRDYREGTKIREESKHPSGDSRASSGTIRQAFATRDSHQCVLHWWQRGLSSRKHDRPLKAQVLQGPGCFTAVKVPCSLPWRQAIHGKEKLCFSYSFQMGKASLHWWDLAPNSSHGSHALTKSLHI